MPPVMLAFHNAARSLKTSGSLLFTAPWVWDGDPDTAVPELFDWTLARDGERFIIVNLTPDGREERFCDIAYDGGPGRSLGHTREHFPNLNQWQLVENGGTYRLINVREDGAVETFSKRKRLVNRVSTRPQVVLYAEFKPQRARRGASSLRAAIH